MSPAYKNPSHTAGYHKLGRFWNYARGTCTNIAFLYAKVAADVYCAAGNATSVGWGWVGKCCRNITPIAQIMWPECLEVGFSTGRTPTGITVLTFPGPGWLLGSVTFVNLTTCIFFISVIWWTDSDAQVYGKETISCCRVETSPRNNIYTKISARLAELNVHYTGKQAWWIRKKQQLVQHHPGNDSPHLFGTSAQDGNTNNIGSILIGPGREVLGTKCA